MRFSYRLGIIVTMCILAVLSTAGLVALLSPRALGDVAWVYSPPTSAPARPAADQRNLNVPNVPPAFAPLLPQLETAIGVTAPLAQASGAPSSTSVAISDTTVTTILRLPTRIAASSTSRPVASGVVIRATPAKEATAADPDRATDVAEPVGEAAPPDERNDGEGVPGQSPRRPSATPRATPVPTSSRTTGPGSTQQPTASQASPQPTTASTRTPVPTRQTTATRLPQLTPTSRESTAAPATRIPATKVPATSIPPTSIPPTKTLAPTKTSAPTKTRPPTNTPAPTRTRVPPTSVPPTAVPPTSVPPTAVPPTNTAIPPTNTPVPPTPVPPTPVPPTDTPVPPTPVPPTPEPPTDTPEPPTDTPEPATDTPEPATSEPEPTIGAIDQSERKLPRMRNLSY